MISLRQNGSREFFIRNGLKKSSEEMMYEDNGERFSIYQIKEGSKAEQYRFLGMDYINKEGLEVSLRIMNVFIPEFY